MIETLQSIHRCPPPAAAAELCTLEEVDDSDAWLVGTSEQQPALDWLHQTYDDAPAVLRTPILLGWRIFGAELGPLSAPDRVLGWTVDLAEKDRARIRVRWRIGLDAEVVALTRAGGFTLASFVRSRSRLGATVWALLSPVHRVVTRVMLALAVRRVAHA
ncbi:MAG: hypothetical protein ACTHNS_11375 [Marmoricola sp.]